MNVTETNAVNQHIGGTTAAASCQNMEHPSKKSIAIVLVTVATCLVVVLCIVLGIAFGKEDAATVNASNVAITNANATLGTGNALGGSDNDTATLRQAFSV